MIIILLVFLLFFIILTIITNKIVLYFDWVTKKDKTAPVIYFSAFVKFYNLAPDKWELGWRKVFYLKKVECYYSYPATPLYETCRESVEFKTFYDTVLYEKWKKALKKKEEEEMKMKNTMDFIKEVQKDINGYEKEAMGWVKKKNNGF